MFKTNAVVAAALCTVGLFSAPAAFAETATVSYADLDLATAEDQFTLERRLEAAARNVCAKSASFSGTAVPLRAINSCYVAAKAKARQQAQVVVAAAEKADDNRLGG